ncbi:MAG: DinB family protein [Anaerolineae bacterium]
MPAPLITSVAVFSDYWQQIHRRTREVVAALPPDRLDWRPAPEEFTAAELVRHIGSARRMNILSATLGESAYPGHDERFGVTLRDLLHYLDATHAEVSNRLAGMPDEELTEARQGVSGRSYPAWDILMGMVEHEIHHRSQLAMYLTLMGVTPPPLYGLYVEDLPHGA